MLLNTVPLLMLELTQGNIDGVLCTDVVGKSYMTVYPGLAVSDVPIEFTSAGVAVAVNKGDNEALLQVINDYIERVLNDGTFDKWFDEALEINGLLLEQEATEGTTAE